MLGDGSSSKGQLRGSSITGPNTVFPEIDKAVLGLDLNKISQPSPEKKGRDSLKREEKGLQRAGKKNEGWLCSKEGCDYFSFS